MTTRVETIELTIDGKKVTGGHGDTVLEVARRNGIYLPTLCYHESLLPEGRCRLCLVDIDGFRAPATACTTKITGGMEVKTDTPMLQQIRRVTAELLLSDHPSDCLICAQNTACDLQKVAAYLGIDRIRYRKLREVQPIDDSNPFFVRDPNKCVLCGRCVQTCWSLQGVGAIDFLARGYRTEVGTFGRQPIYASTCESCGECLVRCPTGAIARRDRRQAASTVKTTCPYCGTGCGMILGVRGREIVWVDGDPDSPVNRGKLCVKGRFGQGFVNSADRLTAPLIERNGVFEKVSWEEALDLVAGKFRQYQPHEIAVVGSSRASNEECYLVQKLARAVFGTNNVDNCARLCHAPTVTGLSKTFGTGGGTNPLYDIEGAACLFVIGSNTTSAHPVAGVKVREAARKAKLIVADPRRIELARHADLWLQHRPGTDVALLMGMARVILEENLHDAEFIATRCEGFAEFQQAAARFDLDTVEQITGVPKEQIVQAARMYATNAPAIIMYSLGITEHTHGTDNVTAIASLAMLTGNVGKPSAGVMPMRGQNNVQGACDMGCIPGAYQGYQAVTNSEARAKHEAAWGVKLPDQPGLYLVDYFPKILEGEIKALYIVGLDPAYSLSNVNLVQEALRKAEFVVFQDIFLTGSAEFADVVLAASSYAEKWGTFTNLERRVQLIRPAIPPVGDSRPDWWITCEIAKRMGARGFDYTHPSEIMDEIAELTPSFAGVSFARLEAGGIQWPCPAPDHPGTPRLHVEKFNTPSGKGQLPALEYRPPAEEPDEQYPILLITGRSLYHFHLAMTVRVPGLMDLHPEEVVWLHPKDTAQLGVAEGDPVVVSSRRGRLQVKAFVTEDVAPGQAFMTFHFYESPTNVLTQQAFDPVSKTPEYKVTAVKVEKAG